MPNREDSGLSLCDLSPTLAEFRQDVIEGLSDTPKMLPCKYFYDDRGSHLFEQICQLDEYYLTRSELAVMRHHAADMAATLGPQAMVIEPGSGSGKKTEILLEHLKDPVAYVPIEISPEHLLASARRLNARFPTLEVLPVCADFTADFELPQPKTDARRRVVYFPGSTIGNFTHAEAVQFLSQIAELVGPGGGALVGADLVKDPEVLIRAYNDQHGITREFNKNLLVRANRELGTDFDLEQFAHRAVYNAQKQRIEIYLVSLCEQSVTLDGEDFTFERGEALRTEYSHKYTLDSFAQLATEGGMEVRQVWTDVRGLFSVQYLEVV